jgi:hypothetical protein
MPTCATFSTSIIGNAGCREQEPDVWPSAPCHSLGKSMHSSHSHLVLSLIPSVLFKEAINVICDCQYTRGTLLPAHTNTLRPLGLVAENGAICIDAICLVFATFTMESFPLCESRSLRPHSFNCPFPSPTPPLFQPRDLVSLVD